jgi:2-isopropylmalate synthase
MLKNRETYEIMTPETVGVQKTKIVLGRHSGRHGLKARLDELGYSLEKDELQKVYDAFTKLADKKKEIYDDDLRILMGDTKNKNNVIFALDYMHVFGGSSTIPTATVRITTDGNTIEDSSTGDGPVDALFNAIDRALSKKPTVESYRVRSVTSGRKALGEVAVRIRKNNRSYTGLGVSTDIIEASARAYIQAINKKERYERNKNKSVAENIAAKI